jgi:hypothetical protein
MLTPQLCASLHQIEQDRQHRGRFGHGCLSEGGKQSGDEAIIKHTLDVSKDDRMLTENICKVCKSTYSCTDEIGVVVGVGESATPLCY